MSHLIIMSGIQGSGKTTFAKQMVKNDNSIIRVSRDEIRFSLISSADKYFSKEKEVKQIFLSQIRENLIKEKTVIADATHTTPRARQYLLSGIGFHPTQITVVWFNVPLEICLERNALRSGRERIPDTVISDMFYTQRKPDKNLERYINRIFIINENNEVIETK